MTFLACVPLRVLSLLTPSELYDYMCDIMYDNMYESVAAVVKFVGSTTMSNTTAKVMASIGYNRSLRSSYPPGADPENLHGSGYQ